MLKTKQQIIALNRFRCWTSNLPGLQQQCRNQSTVTAASSEWEQAKPLSEMPTISPFQLLRHFLPGGKYTNLDTTQLMLAFRRDFGPIVYFKGSLGKPDVVMTNNPHDFEKALHNQGIWPMRPGMEYLSYHRQVHRKDIFQGVEGLLGSQGEAWGSFRSAVNPVLMQPKNVHLYFNKMSEVNKEFMERIRKIRDPQTLEVPDNFEEEINRWTLESVSVVALDKQLGLITKNRDDPTPKRLFKALTDFFEASGDLEFQPSIWKYIKTPTFKKAIRSLDEITDITKMYVDEAFERIEAENKNRNVEKPENEKSVLEKLVKIDKQIAMVMAMDMLMAGVDTTSSTFTGLLLCLAKNPEKQKKLREEIMQLLPQKDSEFNEAVFKNMPYLRACIKESLRVYPLTVGNARTQANDVVISGYRVPKGTLISMNSVTLIKDDAHYPRASEFLPERWLRASKENEKSAECPHALKASSPFVYLPFGFGSRSCIGRRIAEMELELGIARLIRNFHVEFNYPTDNAFKSLLISVPNIPLKFKFTDVDN
ncbi:cytochrome P450 CYP12A2 [Musca domestica]|uniref:Cytochrome P450 CYP12A2 n=2 Tax=Musca domestica TaxID=7370 RepID=C12A2_MUSDO|nr:cytochrome P450 CYP12A2 [Musca domestica]O18635.1 RecName: Full=Cytochrome P450 CYP12A2; AltName: Full=CYPXIIA2 [Musca domestica]AAC98527.1 cytochrome P450 CYP12A2 [Musca domestica]